MGQNITYNEKELGLATRKAIRIMVHTYMSVNIINNLSHHKSFICICTKYEDLPSYLDGKIWHYRMLYRNTTIKCVNKASQLNKVI